MSNEEQDTPPPTLPTLFLPHCVKSSTSFLALDEQWGAGHPIPTLPPFSFLTVWRVLHPCLLLMSNEEQDNPPPTLPTLFLPHCVKSSAWVIICVFHTCLLQYWHTKPQGVWLIKLTISRVKVSHSVFYPIIIINVMDRQKGKINTLWIKYRGSHSNNHIGHMCDSVT